MRHYLLFIITLLFFPLLSNAQTDDEEEEDIEDSISTESLITINGWTDDQNWTDDQRWMYFLRARLDSVINQKRTATVTRRRRVKGKNGRYYYKKYRRTVAFNADIAVSVYDLTADSTIFSHNDKEMFIPASNQKLFVGIAALSSLSADHLLSTRVCVDGSILTDTVVVQAVQEEGDNGELTTDYSRLDTLPRHYLKGNIYIHGGFDPTLDKSSIEYIAAKLMAMDVDSIDGYIYCYEPLKSKTSIGSWFWNKHHSRYFASMLYRQLNENGILFSKPEPYGTIEAPASITAKEYTTLSTPLSQTLHRIMKNSDNFYAESILLNLVNPNQTDSWTYDACKQKVIDMIKRAGGNVNEYIIDDGSGLSHSNMCTASLICTILRYAYRNTRIYEPLYDSLPIAGVDGTIGSRMRGTAAYNNVRAKTGTVNGVSTLSGYVTAANGHKLAFSILVNNLNNKSAAHSLQNQLCDEMAR